MSAGACMSVEAAGEAAWPCSICPSTKTRRVTPGPTIMIVIVNQ